MCVVLQQAVEPESRISSHGDWAYESAVTLTTIQHDITKDKVMDKAWIDEDRDSGGPALETSKSWPRRCRIVIGFDPVNPKGTYNASKESAINKQIDILRCSRLLTVLRCTQPIGYNRAACRIPIVLEDGKRCPRMDCGSPTWMNVRQSHIALELLFGTTVWGRQGRISTLCKTNHV